MTLGERLAAAGLTLPPAFRPAGNYLGVVVTGGQVHVAGMGPTEGPTIVESGRIAGDGDLAKARRAASLTALNLLAQIDPGLRVRAPLKVFALVNCAPAFVALDEALAPAHALFERLFGHPGAWTVVGAPCLPFAISTEMEAIFALEE
ncbi:MAG: RidA family protein [Azospirillum sp.]|nr:RidA family protein [Azospirillum sp.]MCA3267227.1 RidA family protein [Azospirillum sp.]MCZ8122985.1 RidA family protein [Magnetospirillum sp.]